MRRDAVPLDNCDILLGLTFMALDIRALLFRNQKTETVNREPKTAVSIRLGIAKKCGFRADFDNHNNTNYYYYKCYN